MILCLYTVSAHKINILDRKLKLDILLHYKFKCLAKYHLFPVFLRNESITLKICQIKRGSTKQIRTHKTHLASLIIQRQRLQA